MSANMLAAARVIRTHGAKHRRSKAISSSDTDQNSAYRLSAENLSTLAKEFHQHRMLEHPGCHYRVSYKMVESYIAYISGGGYYRQAARCEGISKPTLIFYSRMVASFISSTASNYIRLPHLPEIDHMTGRYVDGKKIIGLVDGFLMKIQRPDHARDEFYSARPGKYYDCMNIQYVCDLDGKIIHVLTGVSGRAHDKNAIEWSPRLRTWLDNLPPNHYILGDSAYMGYHEKCLTLHRNPSSQQQHFNLQASRIRSKVENVIGAQQCIWRILMTKENRVPAKSGLTFPCDVCLSAATLHNRFTNYVE